MKLLTSPKLHQIPQNEKSRRIKKIKRKCTNGSAKEYLANKDQADLFSQQFKTWENKTNSLKERKQKRIQEKGQPH